MARGDGTARLPRARKRRPAGTEAANFESINHSPSTPPPAPRQRRRPPNAATLKAGIVLLAPKWSR